MAKKKNKHRGEHNLSLKERLGRHWRNQKWVEFVELYYRDRSISDQGPWVQYLEDGLYNALTKTILEEPTPDAIRNLANELLKEAKGPDADLLKKCAQIALWLTVKGKPKGLPSTKEIQTMPEPYRTIGRKLLSVKGSRTTKNPAATAELALRKVKKYSNKLSFNSPVASFKAFSKYAATLKEHLANKPDEKIATAIVHIAELLRQLRSKRKGKNTFVDLRTVYEHPDFQALAIQPPHPILIDLWNTFCLIGLDKYGEDWSNGAKLFALKFMPDLDRNMASHIQKFLSLGFKNQMGEFDLAKLFGYGYYEKLIEEMQNNQNNQEYLECFLDQNDLLDQEIYATNIFLLMELLSAEDLEQQFVQDKMLSIFSVLTSIGAVWRQGYAAWTPEIESYFQQVLQGYFTQKSLNNLTRIQLPFAQFKESLILTILCFCPSFDLKSMEKEHGVKISSPLSDAVVSETAELLTSKHVFNPSGWANMVKYLNEEDAARLYEGWVWQLIKNTATYLVEVGEFKTDKPNVDLKSSGYSSFLFKARWDRFNVNSYNIGLKYADKTGLIRALLDILVIDPKSNKPADFTDDYKKLDLFYKKLDQGPQPFDICFLLLFCSKSSWNLYFAQQLLDRVLLNCVKNNSFNYLLMGICGLPDKDARIWLAQKICKNLQNLPNSKMFQDAIHKYKELAKNGRLSNERLFPFDFGFQDKYFKMSRLAVNF
jgi:hypothetical protein